MLFNNFYHDWNKAWTQEVAVGLPITLSKITSCHFSSAIVTNKSGASKTSQILKIPAFSWLACIRGKFFKINSNISGWFLSIIPSSTSNSLSIVEQIRKRSLVEMNYGNLTDFLMLVRHILPTQKTVVTIQLQFLTFALGLFCPMILLWNYFLILLTSTPSFWNISQYFSC